MHFIIKNFIRLLILSLCWFASPLFSASSNSPLQSGHMIIIDAGSTGSRLHLYAYSFPAENQNSLPLIQLKKTVTSKIPITHNDFITKPSSLGPYLLGLFEPMNNELSATQKSQTPIYLFATAGVRNLPAYQQRQLMSNTRNVLIKIILGLNYNLPADINQNVRVIRGQEEGLFSWLTVNYLNGNLKHPQLTAENTAAVVDLGGESAQITFLPQNPPLKHAINFTFNNSSYALYAYSYEDFGTIPTLTKLINNNPLTANQLLAPCFPLNASYPLTNPIVTKTTGNFAQCTAFLQSYLFGKFKLSDCQFHYPRNCSKMGTYQPPLPVHLLYGTANYNYTLSILGLANHPIKLAQIAQGGKKYCTRSWADIKQQFNHIPDMFLITYCFDSAWIYTLLKGFGVGENQSFLAVNNVDNTSVAWPLGSVLYLLSE